MLKLSRLIAFILLCFVSVSALADKLDSLLMGHDSAMIQYYHHHIDSLVRQKLNTVNPRKLDDLQRYNPLFSNRRYYYSTLGNIGLATNPMFYQPVLQEGFNLGTHSFDKYTYDVYNTRYYTIDLPVTYLGYVNGSKKEQYFKVKYNQSIAKTVTLGVDFYIINSPGYYVRQESDDKSVFVTAQYFTKNKRYGVIANYYHNKFVVEENGGILNDSVFEENLITNRKQIDVNLNTAQNLVKEAGVGMSQYFSLARPYNPNDTTQNLKVFHLGKLSYDFHYNRKIQLYTDQEPTNPFYQSFDSILDSVQTYDSVYVQKFENQVSWSNLRIGKSAEEKVIYVRFGVKHQIATVGGYMDKTNFSQLIPNAEVVLHPHKTIDLTFKGNYTVGNFNNNGFYLGGEYLQRFHFKEKDYGTLYAKIFLLSQEKGWFFNEFNSNYIRWKNDFIKENVLSVNVLYRWKRLEAGVRYNNIDNFIYLNTDAKPQQHSKSLSVLALYILKDFRIRKFGMDYSVIFQQASDESVLRLPDWTAQASFFFTLPLFQNAIFIQPGIDLYYNTAYFSDAYMPATRTFYLQNEKEIGNHIYADIHFSLLLKRFRFFLKYSHFNSWFGKNNYYTVPGYPMNDASFKFGLTWGFYD